MASMSLTMHVAILGLVIVDLIAGAALVNRYLGSGPAFGFEFLIILGYILFIVLRGRPLGDREGDDT